MLPGLRVVRGPDWIWDSQDDGEGNVGTVVQVNDTIVNDVIVLWDMGTPSNYRTGFGDAFDLRTLDNAPTGVVHPNTMCTICHEERIRGLRWKCESCENMDLCTKCYMGDKHDLDHTFLRIDDVNSKGISVPKRQGSNKIQSKGLFKGATVIQGMHWKWGKQDETPNNIGIIEDIGHWGDESGNSAAKVTWQEGKTNSYRLGHEGQVDLKCIKPAEGGYYYRDHLPLVGEIDSQSDGCDSLDDLRPGDKVRISLDVETVKEKQQGHGGWRDEMAKCIGATGEVMSINEYEDVVVVYQSLGNFWVFNPEVLVKVNRFSVGDTVKVSFKTEDEKRHKWTDHMEKIRGKTGQVLRLEGTGDIHVVIDQNVYVLDPECCTLLRRGRGKRPSVESAPVLELQEPDIWASLMQEGLRRFVGDRDFDNLCVPSSDNLWVQTILGNSTNVQRILKESPGKRTLSDADTPPAKARKLQDNAPNQVNEHNVLPDLGHVEPNAATDVLASTNIPSVAATATTRSPRQTPPANPQVNEKLLGIGPLHVASHMGHLDIVKILLTAGAEIEMRALGGDTALIAAVIGNKSKIVEFLLSKDANVDASNNNGETALWNATKQNNVECARILLEHKANPNIQDQKDGKTALHVAVSEHHQDLVERLLKEPKIDLTLKNKKGATVLHVAAAKNNYLATKLILERATKRVNDKTKRDSTPLHLAAIHGHLEIVKLLVTEGQAEVNPVNDEYTPLHNSVYQGYPEVVSYLLNKGADVNAVGKHGDNSLHLAIDALKNAQQSKKETFITIACILAHRGVNLNKKNDKGLTPMDNLKDDIIASRVRLAACSRTTAKRISEESSTSALTYDPEKNVRLLDEPSYGPINKNTSQIDRENNMKGPAVVSITEVQTRETQGSTMPPEDSLLEYNITKNRDIQKYRIKRSGGIINLPGGIKVLIPSDAFSDAEYRDLLVGTTENEKDMPTLTPGQRRVSPVVFISPHGMTFDKPIALLIPHSESCKSTREASDQLQILHSQTEIGMPTRWCRWDNSNTGDPAMFGILTEKSCTLFLTHLCLFTITTPGGDIAARSMKIMLFMNKFCVPSGSKANVTVAVVDDADCENFKREAADMQYGRLAHQEPFIVYNTEQNVHLRLKGVKSPWKPVVDEPREKVLDFQCVWRNLHPVYHVGLESDQENPDRIHCHIEVQQDPDHRGLGNSLIINTVPVE